MATDHSGNIRSDPALIWAAWGITGLVSALPDILWHQLSGSVPAWLPFAKLSLVVLLALTATALKPLRPLRNYSIGLAVLFGACELRPHLDFTVPGLQAAFGGSAFDVRMQAEQIGKLAVAAVLMGTLLLLGYKRREFFLALGNPRAPIRPVPLLGFPKADPWPWFGGQWGVYIAAGLAALFYFGNRPTGAGLHQIVPMLPSIVFYAALNAFNEEMAYRAPVLATLEPMVGSRQALGMSAYFFGIAHYFGTPGGVIGGIASIFMGWILGKGMIETRGLFWSWTIHLLSDLVIFSAIALRLVN